MKSYFSTFISGTGKIIERAIKKRSPRIKINLLLDGLIMYESDYEEREIRNLRFFNNTFILLRYFESLEPSTESIEEMIREVLNDRGLLKKIESSLPGKRTEFKIVNSLENKLTKVDYSLIRSLESKLLGMKGLRLNTKKPNLEFWFLLRREGRGFFGIRITYPYGRDKHLARGELREELARILCLASEPNPNDIVLDPFGGHGAIPLERAASFPYKKIVAVENDPKLVNEIKRSAKGLRNFVIERGDSLNLKSVGDEAIDKVITDPPWGLYADTSIPLSEFYQKMLREFARVLKKNGLAILLIGSLEVFEKSLAELPEFKQVEAHNILVSGKKATIFKLRKN